MNERPHRPPASARAAIALALLSLCVAGCGAKAPFPTVPVMGKLTYDDGTPIPSAHVIVRFVSQSPPLDPKTHPRAGWGELLPDGSFGPMTTWKYNDGVIPGPQKVIVQSRDANDRPTGAVDARYGDVSTTPLSIDIEAGKPLDLKIARPESATH